MTWWWVSVLSKMFFVRFFFGSLTPRFQTYILFRSPLHWFDSAKIFSCFPVFCDCSLLHDCVCPKLSNSKLYTEDKETFDPSFCSFFITNRCLSLCPPPLSFQSFPDVWAVAHPTLCSFLILGPPPSCIPQLTSAFLTYHTFYLLVWDILGHFSVSSVPLFIYMDVLTSYYCRPFLKHTVVNVSIWPW